MENIFKYGYSCSLDHRMVIKVGSLDGEPKKPNYYDKLFKSSISECASFFVKIQCFNDEKPFGSSVTTSYKAFIKRWSWNEWVQLPFSFSDLPRTAVLGFTIYDCIGSGKTSIIGGTSISVFGKHGIMREGIFDLKIWFDQEAHPTKTPGKSPKDFDSVQQMQRLAKLAKKHRNGQLEKIDWLDRLTFREIELINEREKRESDYLYLMIEFPSVMYNDKSYSIIYYEPTSERKINFVSKPRLVKVPDCEILQVSNLSVSKLFIKLKLSSLFRIIL